MPTSGPTAWGLPVRLWLSDKQDAFVQGIAAEFPAVPHRYCQNHVLRDLAKPTLEKDSHAKMQMRKKVCGLREIERDVLERRRQGQAPSEAKREIRTEPAERTKRVPLERSGERGIEQAPSSPPVSPGDDAPPCAGAAPRKGPLGTRSRARW